MKKNGEEFLSGLSLNMAALHKQVTGRDIEGWLHSNNKQHNVDSVFYILIRSTQGLTWCCCHGKSAAASMCVQVFAQLGLSMPKTSAPSVVEPEGIIWQIYSSHESSWKASTYFCTGQEVDLQRLAAGKPHGCLQERGWWRWLPQSLEGQGYQQQASEGKTCKGAERTPSLQNSKQQRHRQLSQTSVKAQRPKNRLFSEPPISKDFSEAPVFCLRAQRLGGRGHW